MRWTLGTGWSLAKKGGRQCPALVGKAPDPPRAGTRSWGRGQTGTKTGQGDVQEPQSKSTPSLALRVAAQGIHDLHPRVQRAVEIGKRSDAAAPTQCVCSVLTRGRPEAQRAPRGQHSQGKSQARGQLEDQKCARHASATD